MSRSTRERASLTTDLGTLYQAKLAGKTVSLAMHIPPGIDSPARRNNACPLTVTSFWQDAYARRFIALVGLYKDQLRLSYAATPTWTTFA
jgi:hypothetical protein